MWSLGCDFLQPASLCRVLKSPNSEERNLKSSLSILVFFFKKKAKLLFALEKCIYSSPVRQHSRKAIPFCDEFLNGKKKSWPINKYNFLWFCSNNLGELLYYKPRKLSLLDKQSDSLWHYQGLEVRKHSFLGPVTENYVQTFSKAIRTYSWRLTVTGTKRVDVLFRASLWLGVSKFSLKWSVAEIWVLMSEG